MRFADTPLHGAKLIDLEPIEDDRGYFARTFCRDAFIEHGLNPTVNQCNVAHTRQAGVLRGLHLQLPPAGEAKLVRCLQGAIYDVIVDCRQDSPTFLQAFSVELRADEHRAIYVPELFAHGYQSLTDDTQVMYQVTAKYSPGHERGLRYNDPDLAISWPLTPQSVSEKDTVWPLIRDGAMEGWF